MPKRAGSASLPVRLRCAGLTATGGSRSGERPVSRRKSWAKWVGLAWLVSGARGREMAGYPRRTRAYGPTKRTAVSARGYSGGESYIVNRLFLLDSVGRLWYGRRGCLLFDIGGEGWEADGLPFGVREGGWSACACHCGWSRKDVWEMLRQAQHDSQESTMQRAGPFDSARDWTADATTTTAGGGRRGGGGYPQRGKITKRTQFCAGRRGKVWKTKPKTNPFWGGGRGSWGRILGNKEGGMGCGNGSPKRLLQWGGKSRTTTGHSRLS
jgi:hypothetical protein